VEVEIAAVAALLRNDMPGLSSFLHCRIDPALSVLAAEKAVRLAVANDCFSFAVPLDAAADLQREHAQQAHGR